MKALATSLVVLTLLAGVALVAYGRWTNVVARADAALAQGRHEEALALYEQAETRLQRAPLVGEILAREYGRVAANRLWILYRLKRWDATIEAAERAPAGAAPHFWAGSAFFEKARAEEQPDARLGWLARAENELRQAVEAAPDDWDTKFDFELTSRLIAELRKQPKTPPSQMMQLLRPPAPTTKAPRRVG